MVDYGTCPSCGGSCERYYGVPCSRCGGSGEVPNESADTDAAWQRRGKRRTGDRKTETQVGNLCRDYHLSDSVDKGNPGAGWGIRPSVSDLSAGPVEAKTTDTYLGARGGAAASRSRSHMPSAEKLWTRRQDGEGDSRDPGGRARSAPHTPGPRSTASHTLGRPAQPNPPTGHMALRSSASGPAPHSRVPRPHR